MFYITRVSFFFSCRLTRFLTRCGMLVVWQGTGDQGEARYTEPIIFQPMVLITPAFFPLESMFPKFTHWLQYK